jgi:hypothetical protein
MGLKQYELKKIMEAAPKELNGRSLFYKPSYPDPLDIKYHEHIGIRAIQAVQPLSVDLRSMLPPCFDQQQRGCCVAEGAAAMKAYQENIQADYPINGLSVAYLYIKCKQNDGDQYNEGTEPKVAMQMLKQYGICPEDIMPTSSLLSLPTPQLPSIPTVIVIMTDSQSFKHHFDCMFSSNFCLS